MVVRQKLIQERQKFSREIDTKIADLQETIKPHPEQNKANVRYNLLSTQEKIETLSEYKQPWDELPGYLLANVNCTYVYTKDDSDENTPSETITREEKNCFQDYATRQIINLQNLEEKFNAIRDDAKFPIFKIDFKDSNGVIDREFKDYKEVREHIRVTRTPNDNDYVYPEVAQFLAEIEIIKQNIARKEALLRYNTNFFYLLDDLIEKESTEKKILLKLNKQF